MFLSIDYLEVGNKKQREVFDLLKRTGMMNRLSKYTPVLCGTIPIGIDIEGSDLDIILFVEELDFFEEEVKRLFVDREGFRIKRLNVRNVRVIKANFFAGGYEFELFGQPRPVTEQYAYLHMVIEHVLMKRIPGLKENVIKLKKSGVKTEPAFCQLLGIEGDPYEQLILYGKNNDII
ncbi:DUF4269 domain-containing protein [Fictibacillus aquaticus]|uniref:Alpha/beta hydrolase n=1 Tax=Fictibacillus aquaticus TaxID=2021314 RepID=A0A235F5Y2_9BACL|nr:DUF4269 domain-containing protein [Fictibacillus aquaticus]OYD56584.1 alpha/beta hydrolase [Fictibacillus aquaticus]